MLSSVVRSVDMLGVDLDAQLVERANTDSANRVQSASLQFRALNVVTAAEERDELWSRYLASCAGGVGRKRFDVAFCFSTTMWIHLNHGDAGLESLLTCLANWADNIILEPQPWKCYRNAARRLRRANRPPFPYPPDSLVHRSEILDHIDDVFRNRLGMQLHAHLGHSEWQRPVLWYKTAVCPSIA